MYELSGGGVCERGGCNELGCLLHNDEHDDAGSDDHVDHHYDAGSDDHVDHHYDAGSDDHVNHKQYSSQHHHDTGSCFC